jgi:hypothetical protein
MTPFTMNNIEAAEFDFPSYWANMKKNKKGE